MKASLQHILTTAVILGSVVESDALKSSVRGGAESDVTERFDGAGFDVDANLSSRAPPRRFLHSEMYNNERQDKQQSKRRQEEQETSTYWWLNKSSSEKDIVYKPSEEEDNNARNGRDSFSVFTITRENNPDTSMLPYRAPSKKLTEQPSSAPTETISGSFTMVSTDAPIVQKFDSYTKQLDEDTYHFPIWTNTFKGCTTSSLAPEVYNKYPDEYLFPSILTCCQTWFDSEECSPGENVMTVMSSTEKDIDEEMFRMNGIEAYSGGGGTSEDSASQDGPRPSPPTPSGNPPSPSDTTASSTPGNPSVGTLLGTGTPTYMPTGETNLFPDIITGGVVTVATSSPVSTAPQASTSSPVSPPVPENTGPPVSVTPPTPAAIFEDTPYPTFGALPQPDTTDPPVFVLIPETYAPTLTGTSVATAPPVIGFVPTPTEWPTFSDFTPVPSVDGGRTRHANLDDKQNQKAARLFMMSHLKSDRSDD